MKVAVTGCTSDFGTAILPALFTDPDIDEVIGTGLTRDSRVSHPKLRFVRADMRWPEIGRCFAGCDVVVHLAFAVEEMRDKDAQHAINLGGTENVIRRAHEAGVKRLVIASSISAYGARDREGWVDEGDFVYGSPDRYYFYDKAEVEHFVQWWAPRHPEMQICLLRPPWIIGPSTTNSALGVICAPVMPWPDPEHGRNQILHERDLASAFHLAVKQPLEGPFNVATTDCLRATELAQIHGQRQIAVPEKATRRLADAAYALRLAPGSGDWVLPGEAVVDSSRFMQATGWSPQFTSRESAHLLFLQYGRGIVSTAGELQRPHVIDAALEPATAVVSRWCDEIPALQSLTGGSERFGEAIDDVEHVFLDIPGATVHLEVHRSGTGVLGTVLIEPAPGAHARLYSPIAVALAQVGADVVVVDLPGHGLSTGRRGDAPLALAARAVEAARRYAEEELDAPVWTADDGPAVNAGRRPAGPLAVLARLAPGIPVPVRALLRALHVDVPAHAADLLELRADPLICRTVTARTAVGYAQRDPDAIARALAFASLPLHAPLGVLQAPDAVLVGARPHP